LNLPQTSNRTPHGNSTGRAQTVCTTRHGLPTALTVPNTHHSPLDRILTAECTAIGGVLGDFDLTKKLTEGGTVTGSVLSGDANFSCAVLTHLGLLIH
jgi:hypothetical protein